MPVSRGNGRLLVGLATSAGLVLAAAAKDRYDKVQRAPQELRSPALYLDLPIDVPGLGSLRDLLAKRPAGSVSGVAVRHQTVPATDAGPAVPVHILERPGRARPSAALLWIHGGGFVGGSSARALPQASRFARELDLVVVSVDYRLAPQHPFPAALDDCAAALAWLHQHADALGVDPSRIAVGGASAGGGLAATLAQRAHDEGTPVALQLLVSPMLDDRSVNRVPPAGVGELGFTAEENRSSWAAYLGTEPGGTGAPPYAAASRRFALSGLPPAWIGVGTTDVLHGEDVAYAERLREAGVEVTLDVVEGLYHGADSLVPDAPQSRAFFAAQVDALRRRVAPAG